MTKLRVSLFVLVLAVTACASGTARDESPPPRLGTAYPQGRELRFRRVITSSAHNRQLAARGGPDGVDIRAEIEFLVRVSDAAGAQAPQLIVRPESLAFETKGLRGEVSFDSRDPASLRALEGTREGPSFLQALRTVLGVEQNFGLSSDGAPGDRSRAPALPFGLWEGSLPGMPPFGETTGSAEPGRSWDCDGVLRAGRAGLSHDDPLTFRGTWTVAAWDAGARTARLVLTGASSFDDTRLRTTRVVSLGLAGEAVWDADLRLVTRSSVKVDVVLRPIEVPDARIEWSETIDEELLP